MAQVDVTIGSRSTSWSKSLANRVRAKKPRKYRNSPTVMSPSSGAPQVVNQLGTVSAPPSTSRTTSRAAGEIT